MIDKVLRATNAPDTDIMGDKRAVIMDYINAAQQEWAERTLRWTKKAYCTTRATGSDRSRMEYNLLENDNDNNLPYGYISVRRITFDKKVIDLADADDYLARRTRNDGDADYGDPQLAFIENAVIHLWPIPDTAKELWILYSARPNDITAETDNIAIPETSTLLYGVLSMLFAHMKDNDRAFYWLQRFEKRLRQQTNVPHADSGAYSPFMNAHDAQTHVGPTGDLYGGR
jgi:hypothetical protein